MSRDLKQTGSAPLPRCLAVWAVATAALAGLAGWLEPSAPRLAAAASGYDFAGLLVGVCEVVLLGCAGWLWVATGVVLLDAARGRVRRRVGVPGALRGLVLTVCGVTLAGALSAPAHTAPSPALPADPAPGGHGSAALVRGLPLPDRASAVGHVARLLLRRAHPPERPVVVRPGDTLWGLAAARLPDTAGDAAVDAAWRRLYRANRREIGPDPDLIHPGQRLELPR